MPPEVRARRLGRLSTEERVRAVFDDGVCAECALGFTAEDREALAKDGFYAVSGRVGGRETLVLATDYRVDRGTLGVSVCRASVEALTRAAQLGTPTVLLLDSDGVRLSEGEPAMLGVADLLGTLAEVAGRMPLVAVVFAVASGAAAYAAALADFTIAVDERAFAFVAGPGVVRVALGREPSLSELGGTRLHMEQSGLVQLAARDDRHAIDLARGVLGYVPEQRVGAAREARVHAPREPAVRLAAGLLPSDRSRPYDVHPLIHALVDEGSFLELGERFGPSVRTGFARLQGAPVGLVASQPACLSGAIDADASQKLARFVRYCAAFGLPVVTLADTPGFLPGPASERARILIHGAKVIAAYAEARGQVPLVALIVRRAAGGGAVLALGADTILGLPGYELISMSERAAATLGEPAGDASMDAGVTNTRRVHEVSLADARAAVLKALAADPTPPPTSRGPRRVRLTPL
ncbi:MAG: hypothetical protein KBB95_15855 [Deltaproteobacteria bacterium]|nr:hypothetical protein [Deltaproteobacteria bacterium]